jgi:hypothetical protein
MKLILRPCFNHPLPFCYLHQQCRCLPLHAPYPTNGPKCWTNNSFKNWRAFLVLQYLPRLALIVDVNIVTNSISTHNVPLYSYPPSIIPSQLTLILLAHSIRLLLLADKTSSWHWFFTLVRPEKECSLQTQKHRLKIFMFIFIYFLYP